MKQVSKEDFLKVYNEHAPNLFLRIMYKDFSTDWKKSLGTKIIVGLFIVFNILAIILDARKGGTIGRNMSLVLANFPFVLWGVTAFIAWVWDKLRIKRISKILGLTAEEYNYYADLYAA